MVGYWRQGADMRGFRPPEISTVMPWLQLQIDTHGIACIQELEAFYVSIHQKVTHERNPVSDMGNFVWWMNLYALAVNVEDPEILRCGVLAHSIEDCILEKKDIFRREPYPDLGIGKKHGVIHQITTEQYDPDFGHAIIKSGFLDTTK
jgi:hypothetical protein